jgi:hypothetical protein
LRAAAALGEAVQTADLIKETKPSIVERVEDRTA